MLKVDEIKFFITCLNKPEDMSFRELINIINEFINYKKCWYYLQKWEKLGFYNYGVCSDLGWFELDKLPQRYKEICESAKEV